jgi:hypothetical protein
VQIGVHLSRIGRYGEAQEWLWKASSEAMDTPLAYLNTRRSRVRIPPPRFRTATGNDAVFSQALAISSVLHALIDARPAACRARGRDRTPLSLAVRCARGRHLELDRVPDDGSARTLANVRLVDRFQRPPRLTAGRKL